MLINLKRYIENYHFSVNFYSIFLLFTTIPDLVGMDGNIFKFTFWGLKLLLACWVISKNRQSFFRFNELEFLFILTFFIYLSNIFIDVFINPIPRLGFSRGLMDFIGFFLGLILAFSFRYQPAFHGNKSFWVFCISLSIGLIISYFNARENIDLDVSNIRYDANSTINSIVYGQTGCALALIAVYGFINKPKKLHRFFFILAFIIGIISIAKAGSRSPVVVLVLVTTFYLISRLGSFKGLMLILGFSFLIFIFLNPLLEFLDSIGSNIAVRLTNMVVEKETSGRDSIYQNTWNIIQTAPLFGAYYVLPSGVGAGGYPHNFFLEVLLATGLLGSVPFFILIIVSLFRSYRILSIKHPSSWLVILYLQILTYGMFSIGLYTSQDLWVLLFYIISINMKSKEFLSEVPNN